MHRVFTIVRWIIGVYLFALAARFVMHGGEGGGHGHARWFVLALGGAEMVASAFLLVPRTVLPAAAALLAILGVAAGVHLSRGEVPRELFTDMLVLVLLIAQRVGRSETEAARARGAPHG